jgi:Pentapeptide repeats (8 copies)
LTEKDRIFPSDLAGLNILHFERKIRDPLYGYVYITKLENEIIDTPEFQRLDRLYQNPVARFVYPNGTHTRKAHSFGVMHLYHRAIFSLIYHQNKELNLSEANLSNTDLTTANLSRANLSDARLLGANLSDASLSYARLLSANLSNANLSRANLSGAHLDYSIIIGCRGYRDGLLICENADFKDAIIDDIILTEYLTKNKAKNIPPAAADKEELRDKLEKRDFSREVVEKLLDRSYFTTG